MNLESWSIPDKDFEDPALENQFEILLQTLPILYSARQNAQLKRRWPLSKAVLVAPKKVQEAIQKLEPLFLELGNMRTVEYADDPLEVDSEKWATASEGETQVLLDKIRDDTLKGEGLMRDLARRVQVLRKELGFSPTDIVKAVHIAELEPTDVELLNPFLTEMQDLVRAKQVHIHVQPIDMNADWHENRLDKKKVYIAVL